MSLGIVNMSSLGRRRMSLDYKIIFGKLHVMRVSTANQCLSIPLLLGNVSSR